MEVELTGLMKQAAVSESGAALATQQRTAEERGRKLARAENRAALLEAEVAELRNELEQQFSDRYVIYCAPHPTRSRRQSLSTQTKKQHFVSPPG